MNKARPPDVGRGGVTGVAQWPAELAAAWTGGRRRSLPLGRAEDYSRMAVGTNLHNHDATTHLTDVPRPCTMRAARRIG